MSCVAAFIEGFYVFIYPLIFSCYARVPLNSGWRTTGGTRTAV
jgi:hypothetical protein